MVRYFFTRLSHHPLLKYIQDQQSRKIQLTQIWWEVREDEEERKLKSLMV